MGPPELTIIIPAYNEESIIRDSLDRVRSFVGNKYSYLLCVADDGSTDSTAQIVRKAAKNDKRISLVQLEKNAGRGAVLTTALKECKTKFAVYFDADLQIDLSLLCPIMSSLRYGHDIVIGSKHHPSSQLQHSMTRRFVSKAYRTCSNFITQCPLRDFQCGFKGFNIKRIKPVLQLLRQKRWSWDTEFCVKAYWAGFSIKELPATIMAETRQSKVKVIRDAVRMFLGLLQIRSDKRGFLKEYCARNGDNRD